MRQGEETRMAVDKMDVWQKLFIYNHYVVTNLSLKHNFEIVNKDGIQLTTGYVRNRETLPWWHGRGKPDKELKYYATYRLWKNIPIKTFEEFCCPSTTNPDYIELYDWYWKFHTKISFKLLEEEGK